MWPGWVLGQKYRGPAQARTLAHTHTVPIKRAVPPLTHAVGICAGIRGFNDQLLACACVESKSDTVSALRRGRRMVPGFYPTSH